MTQNEVLWQRLVEQKHVLQVHQVELRQQNEELRQVNAELELARRRYLDLFESAPVGYVVCDRQGVIQEINSAGCTQLGTRRAYLIGRPFSLFVAGPQRSAFAALGSRVGAGSETAPARLETRMVRQDGLAWDALAEVSRLPRDQTGVRVMLTDISDLKEAQREAERRAAEVQQLDDERQAFLHAMTHDLTRPLRQVEGFARLLRSGLQALDEKGARHLEHLLSATTDLGALMTSLARFLQEGQPVEGEQQVPSLAQLVEEVFWELQPQCRGRQVVLTHDTLPELHLPARSLHLIFTELLSNAVKFTRFCAEARIHVGYQQLEETHLFSVRDNGVGFDMRQSPRLFQVFGRLHSARDFEGPGLGLALVRRVVERHRGRLWAEGQPGEGAVFWVQLPRTPSALPEQED